MKTPTERLTKRELREAAAQLGRRGYKAREDKHGLESIRETALENIKKAQEKRWVAQ